jgi:hypothetical protein
MRRNFCNTAFFFTLLPQAIMTVEMNRMFHSRRIQDSSFFLGHLHLYHETSIVESEGDRPAVNPKFEANTK